MKPEIINGLFALGGASIGVFGSWVIAQVNKEKQRITLLVSPCSKLLDVGDLAKSEVQITYRDTTISDLSAGEFAAQNTGTKPLENIEINVVPNIESPVLDFDVSSLNFSAEDDFIGIEKDSDERYKIIIRYLNPKDRAVFNYRVGGTESPEISVRQLGLDVQVRQESITGIPDIYAELMFSIIENIPLPGYSWLLSRVNKPYRLYLEAKRKET
ncbi:hypothetical protein AB4234_14550 [Vibrio cyclitrophicus]